MAGSELWIGDAEAMRLAGVDRPFFVEEAAVHPVIVRSR